MTFILVITSVIAAIAGWHLQKTTINTSPKIVRAVRINGIVTLCVVLLAGGNQFISEINAKKLRSYDVDLMVSENLAQRRIDILNAYFTIYANTALTNSYLKYTHDIKAIPVESRSSIAWETVASQPLQNNINDTKKALETLHNHSLQLLDLAIRYPTRIPISIQTWANKTLDIHMEELPEFINANHQSPKSLEYAKLLGKATGAAIRSVIDAEKNITDS